jgi:hypothetical protein
VQLPPDPPSNQRGGSGIPGRPDASIVNKGTITASSRGFAALVAPDARNSGTVTATLGTVPLAAGNSFTLDMYGDKLITLAVGDSIAAKVINVATGKRVPGGQRSAEPQQTGTTVAHSPKQVCQIETKSNHPVKAAG